MYLSYPLLLALLGGFVGLSGIIWLGFRIKQLLLHWGQLSQQLSQWHQHQQIQLQNLPTHLQQLVGDFRQQVLDILAFNTDSLTKQVQQLMQQTQQHLKEISGHVDKRLSDSFEKTNHVFNDVLKRLLLIDEAQKKITELSSHVVSLQQVLTNKTARGAFGEIQLEMIIDNVLPSSKYAMQYTLSNGKRADCVLFLPPPTGTIAIDAKFPLENFQRMTQAEPGTPERTRAASAFRTDVQRHIQDITNKYIIPGETAAGAILFLPAEAVFAEIHSHFPDIVELAQRLCIWLVSPSTLMAILTTAASVIKQEATQQQVHIIQEHLRYLADDFTRFQQRMEMLTKHIEQANKDVQEVNTSARKISSRFQKIEKVEIPSNSSSLSSLSASTVNSLMTDSIEEIIK